MYKRQLWVNILVSKLGNAQARLPLKVYERLPAGDRLEAPESAYARLLANPHPLFPAKFFWLWVASTIELHGEAFLVKRRDRGGTPTSLDPIHPANVFRDVDRETGVAQWSMARNITGPRTTVAREDLVHFKNFNSLSSYRGLSKLEPLRATLESEAGIRVANNGMWRRGGRPAVTLKHPGQLKSQEVLDHLRDQWNEMHAGVDNWGKPLIMEEGMEAVFHPLSSDALEYVESRKLNREEVCAAFDVPPPVVHILDNATFSNITEQMRSMYRDTVAPRLAQFESTLEHDLRDGRFGRDVEPDFGDELYAEHLMDEVLRGAFEVRVASIAQGIQTGQLTPNEGRAMENRPRVDGGDTLFVNGAVVPLSEAAGATVDGGVATTPREIAELLQKLYLSVGVVITAAEARRLVARTGLELDADGLPELMAPEPPALVAGVEGRALLMGRLSRQDDIAAVDPIALVKGVNADMALAALRALDAVASDGGSVTDLRSRIKEITA